uniref:Uncharacterized protein n=1 Tax=Ailuropoda melanoleuca TaxID=9646 RepID=A0A7N5JR56_AILME
MVRHRETGPQRQRDRDKKRPNERQTTDPCLRNTQTARKRSKHGETTPQQTKSGRTEGERQVRALCPGHVGGEPLEEVINRQSKVHPGLGSRRASCKERPGPALHTPGWLLLPSAGSGHRAQAGRKGRDEAALRVTLHSLPVCFPPLSAPLPALPAHRVPPGPVGGAGVLPVTLLAQSSRAV